MWGGPGSGASGAARRARRRPAPTRPTSTPRPRTEDRECRYRPAGERARRWLLRACWDPTRVSTIRKCESCRRGGACASVGSVGGRHAGSASPGSRRVPARRSRPRAMRGGSRSGPPSSISAAASVMPRRGWRPTDTRPRGSTCRPGGSVGLGRCTATSRGSPSGARISGGRSRSATRLMSCSTSGACTSSLRRSTTATAPTCAGPRGRGAACSICSGRARRPGSSPEAKAALVHDVLGPSFEPVAATVTEMQASHHPHPRLGVELRFTRR